MSNSHEKDECCSATNRANGGVCTISCRTTFRKQSLVWLKRPTPAFRPSGSCKISKYPKKQYQFFFCTIQWDKKIRNDVKSSCRKKFGPERKVAILYFFKKWARGASVRILQNCITFHKMWLQRTKILLPSHVEFKTRRSITGYFASRSARSDNNRFLITLPFKVRLPCNEIEN